MTSFCHTRCKYGHQTRQLCSSTICHEYPAVCRTTGCQCGSDHQKCPQFVNQQVFISKLMETPPDVTLYTEVMEEILDNMLVKLNQLMSRFRIYKNRKWKSQSQKEILSIVKNQQFERLTPALVKSLMTSSTPQYQLPDSDTFKKHIRSIIDDFDSSCHSIETLLFQNTQAKGESLKFRKTCLQTLKFQSGRSIDYLEIRSSESNMVFNKMDPLILKYDKIYYLQLRSQGLGASDIESLGRVLVNLTTLDLCECEVDDQTAIELANYFPKLNTLWLRKNNIRDEGAIAIANHCENLAYFNIARNPIDEQTKTIVKKKLKNTKVVI